VRVDHPKPVSAARGFTARSGTRQAADVAGLIELITIRRHETLRGFSPAVRLAWAAGPARGHALADHLASMATDLEGRKQWSEQVLFPILLGDETPRAALLVGRALAQHAVAAAQIDRMHALASGYAVPLGSGETWWSLMCACRKLDCELRAQMRLEARLGAAFPLKGSSGKPAPSARRRTAQGVLDVRTDGDVRRGALPALRLDPGRPAASRAKNPTPIPPTPARRASPALTQAPRLN
jgi:hypothetical protein